MSKAVSDGGNDALKIGQH